MILSLGKKGPCFLFAYDVQVVGTEAVPRSRSICRVIEGGEETLTRLAVGRGSC